jgi:hypothetical protein
MNCRSIATTAALLAVICHLLVHERLLNLEMVGRKSHNFDTREWR